MHRVGQVERFSLRDALVASGMVACVFFFFLIFAQFALLHRIEELDAEKRWLQPVMLLMGLGGLLGSVLGWKLFSVERLRRLLGLGFLLCAGLGFAAGSVERIEVFLGIGFLVGLFLGVLTVSVVTALRLLVSPGRIGRWAGLGTGVAYFGSNVPAVFGQVAAWQCMMAGGVSMLGAVLVLGVPRGLEASRLVAMGEEEKSWGLGFWSVVALFFVLVWLDSAAFYAIQESEGMKDETWGTASHLWVNALVHLLFGLGSGFLLERGWLRFVLGGAVALLVAGCLWLLFGYGEARWLGAGLYVGGVSLYSTALVAVMAMRGESEGWWSIVRRATVLFALAGWVSSGLGIGMARDLGTVPVGFLGLASLATVVVFCLDGRKRRVSQG